MTLSSILSSILAEEQPTSPWDALVMVAFFAFLGFFIWCLTRD